MLIFVMTLLLCGCIDMQTTKYSIGKNLTAGTANTLFTVPTGYRAIVTMLFIANAGGSTAGVSAAWVNGTTITFQGNKSVGSGDNLQFGGPFGHFLAMGEGDSITVTPDAGSTFTVIASFEIERHNPSSIDFS